MFSSLRAALERYHAEHSDYAIDGDSGAGDESWFPRHVPGRNKMPVPSDVPASWKLLDVRLPLDAVSCRYAIAVPGPDDLYVPWHSLRRFTKADEVFQHAASPPLCDPEAVLTNLDWYYLRAQCNPHGSSNPDEWKEWMTRSDWSEIWRTTPAREEAIANTGLISRAAMAYFEQHNRLPPSVRPTPPLSAIGARATLHSANIWDDATWVALGFSIHEPHYCAYEFTSDAHGFSVKAYTRADDSGADTTFERQGSLREDGTMQEAKGIYIDNTDE